MYDLIIVISCGFAWAWGGEHFLGRWRRGVVLLPVIFLAGYLRAMPWQYYFMQTTLAWMVYQALFYDDCVKWLWAPLKDWQRTLIGYVGLAVNGLLISAAPISFWFIQTVRGNQSYHKMIISGIILMIAFPLVCIGSNVWEWKLPGQYRLAGKTSKNIWDPEYRTWYFQVWGGRDSWWVSEFILGCLLGGCFCL